MRINGSNADVVQWLRSSSIQWQHRMHRGHRILKDHGDAVATPANGNPGHGRSKEVLDLSWLRMMTWTLAYASVADGQPFRAALRRFD